MKRFLLLGLAVLWLVPAHSHAARVQPPIQRYCGDSAISTNVTAVRVPVRCLSGYVMRTNAGGMLVKSAGVRARIIRFRFDTEFQSNNALGTFDGVQPGDFVCLTVIKPAFVIRVLLIVMDTAPFPCFLHRARPVDSGSTGAGTSQGSGSGQGNRGGTGSGQANKGGAGTGQGNKGGTGSGGTVKPKPLPTPRPKKPRKRPVS